MLAKPDAKPERRMVTLERQVASLERYSRWVCLGDARLLYLFREKGGLCNLRGGWLSQRAPWLHLRNGWLSQKDGWLPKIDGWLSQRDEWLL